MMPKIKYLGVNETFIQITFLSSKVEMILGCNIDYFLQNKSCHINAYFYRNELAHNSSSRLCDLLFFH